MPEHDNDRLEQFFRKAAGQTEVPFDERDWKKLEARLDAEDLLMSRLKKSQAGPAVTTGVVLLLLFSGALWMNYIYDFIPVRRVAVESVDAVKQDANSQRSSETSAVQETQDPVKVSPGDQNVEAPTEATGKGISPTKENESITTVDGRNKQDLSGPAIVRSQVTARGDEVVSDLTGEGTLSADHNMPGVNGEMAERDEKILTSWSTVAQLDDAQIRRDLTTSPSGISERYKQKASIELPGAEEGTTSVAKPVADRKRPERQYGAPRLSLLLSLAPDCSGTSLSRYSAPGKAFGAMVYYHITNRWSVSAGVVKSNKQYSGAGEEYHPPHGYWKYYTNGRIPNSVDGACTVLEFPIMAGYSINPGKKNTWRITGGVSSYLMLDESYQYIFDEPNPGATEGWNSRGSSRFPFSIINVALAYEHEVLPGLRVGLEPYVKIPVSEIGWSNLKLFSSGASLTLRYALIRQKDHQLYVPGRGPD